MKEEHQPERCGPFTGEPVLDDQAGTETTGVNPVEIAKELVRDSYAYRTKVSVFITEGKEVATSLIRVIEGKDESNAARQVAISAAERLADDAAEMYAQFAAWAEDIEAVAKARIAKDK